MGVKVSGSGNEEKITFSCDHIRCSAKTVRRIYPHWYARQTGQTYRGSRRARNPIAYWAKVLRNPRRRNTPVFFLLGHETDWPEGIKVLCKEHYATRKNYALQKPKPVPEHQEAKIKRWQEREARRYR